MSKALAFAPGLLSLGFSGYLCAVDKPYAWFLALGFILSLCALGGIMPPLIKDGADVEAEE